MTPVLRRIMARRSKAVRARRRSLRHCAPWAGRGIRQWAGGRVRGMGVAGRPSRLVRMYSQNPRGWKTGLAVLRRARNAPRCCCRPARQGVRSSSAVAPCGLRKAGQGPGRQAQGCAAQGGGRAERNRSWSVLFWSGRFRPVVLVLLSGMSRALRGMWIRLRSSARNGCSGRHWVGFRVRSGSGLAFRCRMAKPCAFAISRRAAGFARRALCFGCALAACLDSVPWIRPCRLPFI